MISQTIHYNCLLYVRFCTQSRDDLNYTEGCIILVTTSFMAAADFCAVGGL